MLKEPEYAQGWDYNPIVQGEGKASRKMSGECCAASGHAGDRGRIFIRAAMPLGRYFFLPPALGALTDALAFAFFLSFP